MKASHEQQRDLFEVQLTFSVQTDDIDGAGTVSNITYIRWLENLRLTMLDMYWRLDREIARCRPVLASTHIERKHPIRLFEQPVGKMWLAGLGRVQWTVQAEICCGQKLVATATQVGFQVNCITMRPISIPEQLFQDYWEYQWSQ